MRIGDGEGIYLDMAQTRWDLGTDLREPFAGVATLRLRAGFNDYEHAGPLRASASTFVSAYSD